MSRRTMLACASAAASVAAPITALARSTTVREKPELIALGAELDQAEATFHAAHGAKVRARTAFDAVCLPVPPELVLKDDDEACFASGMDEEDIEGNRVYLEPKAPPRIILTSKHLAADADDYGPRTKFGRLVRKKLAIARDYDRRVAEAADRTGIKEAIDARRQAIRDIDIIVGKIAGINASSLQGILIKARAILMCEKIAHCNKIWATVLCGPGLAEDIKSILQARLST